MTEQQAEAEYFSAKDEYERLERELQAAEIRLKIASTSMLGIFNEGHRGPLHPKGTADLHDVPRAVE